MYRSPPAPTLATNAVETERRLIWIFPSFFVGRRWSSLNFVLPIMLVWWSAAIQLRSKWIPSVQSLLSVCVAACFSGNFSTLCRFCVYSFCFYFYFLYHFHGTAYTKIARTGRWYDGDQSVDKFSMGFFKPRTCCIYRNHILSSSPLYYVSSQSTENQLKELCFYCFAC